MGKENQVRYCDTEAFNALCATHRNRTRIYLEKVAVRLRDMSINCDVRKSDAMGAEWFDLYFTDYDYIYVSDGDADCGFRLQLVHPDGGVDGQGVFEDVSRTDEIHAALVIANYLSHQDKSVPITWFSCDHHCNPQQPGALQPDSKHYLDCPAWGFRFTEAPSKGYMER